LKLTFFGRDGTYTFKTKKTLGKLEFAVFLTNFSKIASTSEKDMPISKQSKIFRTECETKVARPPTGRPFSPSFAGDVKG
jgi:hypothetical protein